MTPLELKNHIQYKLHIVDADFGATSMLRVINTKLVDFCGKITKAKQGILGTWGKLDLVASQREYPLPADLINNLKAVYLMLDGSNFKRAIPCNVNDVKDLIYQEAKITNEYSNTKPYYFIYRNSIFVLSGTITDVTDGIQFWYSNLLEPIPNLTESSEDLSVSTDKTSAPRQGLPKQFHELLARAVIIEHKDTEEIPLTKKEEKFDKDLEEKISELTPINLDEEFLASFPEDSGEDY